MLGELFNDPIAFITWLIALVVAITIHEFSHAFTADRLGDPLPRMQGRLTLNPLAHLDPLGTIMILVARFGWGKPVQFDPYNLRHPRRDSGIISIAGPISNLTLATISSIFLHILTNMEITPISYIGIQIFQPIVIMNVILAIFNLVPVHPLDGFKIVEAILPKDQAREWHKLERLGFLILFMMVFPIFGGAAPINQIISPVISFLLNILIPTPSSAGIVYINL